MSNAHKIIKNFTSDKFSPELKEKLWKWLVDSSEQAEKEEALMELWEFQGRCRYRTFLSEFPQEDCPPTAEGNRKVYLTQMGASGGCIIDSPTLYSGILPIYTIE